MSGRKRKYHHLSRALVLGTVITLSLSALIRLRKPPIPPSPVVSGAAATTPVSETTLPPAETLSAERINFLLIGQDAREADEPSRSDAMILCSIHPGSQTLTLISFLRDLYVPIPGHACNRLNAAYAFGGMPLLKKTFDHNFGITVDGCFEMDFQQFVRLVDLMGGVRLTLRQDEAAYLNQHCADSRLTEGTQQLDGQQALAYSRIRSLDPDGDFSRTLRQRKLLTALLEQLRQCSLRDTVAILSSFNDLISTDLTRRQIASYASALLPCLSGMELTDLRIPADGTYTPKTIDGMEVLVADAQKTTAILRSVLE